MLSYILTLTIIGLIYLLLVIGLNLEFGFTGLINFGHVGFMAIGAYGIGLATAAGVSLWFGAIAAFVVTIALAGLLGLTTTRLRSDYLAIITLAFAEALRMLLNTEAWATKGSYGIGNIPTLFGELGTVSKQVSTALLFLVLVLATFFTIRFILRTPFGLTLTAIRDREIAVRSLGKNPVLFKTKSLIIGSMCACLSGIFYSLYIGYIVPEQYEALITFYVWIILIVGGAGRWAGVWIATPLFMIILEGTRFIGDFVPMVSSTQTASIRFVLVGLIIIIFMMFRPQGLMGDYTVGNTKNMGG